MSHHGRPHDIGIPGMDHDADDVSSVLQAYISPGTPCIIASPDAAKSLTHVTTHSVLTFAHVNDVIVGWRYCDCTNGTTEIFVGNILPVAPGVCCFPYTTASSTEIKCVLVVICPGNSSTPSAAEGTDQSVLHFGEE